MTQRNAALALLLLAPAPTLAVVFAAVLFPDSPLGKALFIFLKIWIALLPALWWRYVQHGRWSFSPPKRGGFMLGAASGLLITAIIFAAYFLVGRRWIEPAAVQQMAGKTGLNHPVVYTLGAIYWITFNSVLEEYVWRWFVFRQFEKLMPTRLAVVACAAGFTAHHILALHVNFHDWRLTALGSLGVFIGGLTWNWLYKRYQSIWPGYISHAIVDMPIFILGAMLIFG
jgi:membrane protease YdiL (CAAX protease family)